MHLYTTLTGYDITYPEPPADVTAFLAHAKAAVDDPDVSVNQMLSLIYGVGNPILDTTVMPGRAMVTGKVLDNPLYDVLADLVARKEVALGLFDVEKMLAAHTVSVPAAAEQLGVTQQGIRQAIDSRRLPAVRRNGQWWLRPESLATFKVSKAGRPKKSAAQSDAGSGVQVRMGGEPGASLSVLVEGGELVAGKKDGAARLATFPPSWSRAWVKTNSTKDGKKSTRLFVLEPASESGEVLLDDLFVKGPFKVVKRVNNSAQAQEEWRGAGTAEV